MNRIIKTISILSIGVALAASASCSKMLDTSPTTAVSGDTMLQTTEGGYQALNGIYRFFWQWSASTGSTTHEAFGPQGYALMADAMGDDMLFSSPGNGWFWYDYIYKEKEAFTRDSWRPYDIWNYNYTIISQANYIIAAAGTMGGDKSDVDYIVGNAYALRGNAYYNLAINFARSYDGHEDRLCVPIYLEPTTSSTKGKARETNEKVYGQAMEDIDKAITLLKGKKQKHCSHIDYTVANGIKARIALTMNDFDAAYTAAEAAISTTSKTLTDNVMTGYNDAINGVDVLWGAEIITDQGTTNPQFLAHMDPDAGSYGDDCRKLCSKWLYSRIANDDVRKKWWVEEDMPEDHDIVKGYMQYKFKFKDPKNMKSGADHIFMRLPEMYLICAEAKCRLGDDASAQTILNQFMSYRQPGYDCSGKSGKELGALTTDETGSLLEEIILQRRIELWGEAGRMFDIKRLRQGFVRTEEMGYQESARLGSLKTSDPESFDWVMTIPQAELDANPLMVQNPIGSTATATEGDDPALNKAE
ncbi:MAG: RagB/SusD family nutrient uptake outer membrane protein [Candidatus Cryptobacteroides sp.]